MSALGMTMGYAKVADGSEQPRLHISPSAKVVLNIIADSTSTGGRSDVSHKKYRGGLSLLERFRTSAFDTSWTLNDDYVLNPRCTIRKLWDLILTAFVFYLIVVLPMELLIPFFEETSGMVAFELVLGKQC